MSSNPAQGDVYTNTHYVWKFISDLRSIGIYPGTSVSSTNETDRHDKTEILLKVALNAIALYSSFYVRFSTIAYM